MKFVLADNLRLAGVRLLLRLTGLPSHFRGRPLRFTGDDSFSPLSGTFLVLVPLLNCEPILSQRFWPSVPDSACTVTLIFQGLEPASAGAVNAIVFEGLRDILSR